MFHIRQKKSSFNHLSVVGTCQIETFLYHKLPTCSKNTDQHWTCTVKRSPKIVYQHRAYLLLHYSSNTSAIEIPSSELRCPKDCARATGMTWAQSGSLLKELGPYLKSWAARIFQRKLCKFFSGSSGWPGGHGFPTLLLVQHLLTTTCTSGIPQWNGTWKQRLENPLGLVVFLLTMFADIHSCQKHVANRPTWNICEMLSLPLFRFNGGERKPSFFTAQKVAPEHFNVFWIVSFETNL